MKVFISWSGDVSREVGEVFRKWIPRVIQAAKPFMSSEDIEKGARWSSDLPKELESTNVGISIVTADNHAAPWLLFEAGALSKSLERGRVCPILFGIGVSDIIGPLTQFQAAKTFNAIEMRAVMEMMNAQMAEPLAADVFDEAFNRSWPQLEKDVQTILNDPLRKHPKVSQRTERELLDEILEHVRLLSQNTIANAWGGAATQALERSATARLRDLFMATPDRPSVSRAAVVFSREYGYNNARADIYRDPETREKSAVFRINGAESVQFPFRQTVAEAQRDADLRAVSVGVDLSKASSWFEPPVAD